MSTVLVVDDDAGMRDLIRSMLESAQYQVVVATSGVSALPLFREHRPQLVITDILMPDKDGIETVREIRRIDPQAKIIAVSGGGRAKYTDFLRIAQEFGAAEVLEKPFRREDLLAVAARTISA